MLFVLSTHGSLIKADDFLPPVLQQYGAYLAAPSGIGIHGTNLQSKPDNLTDFTFLGCDPKNNTIRHSPLVATPSPTSSSNSTDSSIKAVTDQGGVAPHCEPHIVVFDANAKHVHYTAKWYDGYPKSVRSWEEWSASIDNTYPGSQMTLSDAGVSVKSSAVVSCFFVLFLEVFIRNEVDAVCWVG